MHTRKGSAVRCLHAVLHMYIVLTAAAAVYS
jgi:hypothetical protein